MKNQILLALLYTVTMRGTTTATQNVTECSNYIHGQMLCKETQHIVNVSHGGNVMLNCTCFDDYNSQWLGPNKISGFNTGSFMPYIQGKTLNKILNQSKYRLLSEHHTHKCSLQITNFLSDDDGVYKCLYMNSSIIYVNVFIVSATHESTLHTKQGFLPGTGYFGDMSTEVHVEQSMKTEISTFETKHCSCKSEKYYYHIWQIICALLGGILILSICFNIHFKLKCKKNSVNGLEIPPEGHYYEIETINESSARIQGVPNNVQEPETCVDILLSQSTDSLVSSESSVLSFSNKLNNEDGYENPYQTIDPENIEMHPYNIVTSQMYQNTIIFQKEITEKNIKQAIQKNIERGPWLRIYKKTCDNE